MFDAISGEHLQSVHLFQVLAMKFRKYIRYFSSFISLGLLFFLGLNQFFTWVKWDIQSSENRKKASFPVLNVNRLDAYPSEMDAYINDNFYLRPFLLLEFHKLKYVMGVSPNPKKVIVGNDGWLFLGMKDQEVYEGHYPFGREQLDSFYAVWEQRFNYFEKKQIHGLWAIAPIKQYFYEEHMPPNKKRNFQNRTVKLQTFLDQKIPGKTIYLGNSLQSKKSKGVLFYKHDNHWNSLAGYYSYLVIMENLQKEIKDLNVLTEKDVIRIQKETNTGSLSNFVGLEGRLKETVVEVVTKEKPLKEMPKYGFKAPADFPYEYVYECRYVNPRAKNKQKILVIRDSFGDALLPFFQQTFSETMYVFDAWEYKLNENIIDRFQPDIVVFLTVESFADHILNKPNDVH